MPQDDNVHCVAIKGTFDDCQDIVKDPACPYLGLSGL